MTLDERDSQLGRILREYKEAQANVSCLAVGIRRAATDLITIEKLLQDTSDTQLASQIRQVSMQDLESVLDRVHDVQRELNRRDALKSQLNELGYREILR